MENTSFEAKIEAIVKFTADEIAILKRMSEQHYDHLCQIAFAPGGFMYPFVNKLALDDGGNPMERAFTFRQLDTLCKILETPYRDHAVAFKLSMDIGNVLNRINEITVQINKQLDTK